MPNLPAGQVHCVNDEPDKGFFDCWISWATTSQPEFLQQATCEDWEHVYDSAFRKFGPELWQKYFDHIFGNPEFLHRDGNWFCLYQYVDQYFTIQNWQDLYQFVDDNYNDEVLQRFNDTLIEWWGANKGDEDFEERYKH